MVVVFAVLRAGLRVEEVVAGNEFENLAERLTGIPASTKQ